MACVIVPIGEAIVTTIAARIIKKHEDKKGITDNDIKVPFSKKLNLLNRMLWGGSGLLVFEHIWHGELTPWFPFLTNAANSADTAAMLYEMATTGTLMSLFVTAVWGAILIVAEKVIKRDTAAVIAEETTV